MLSSWTRSGQSSPESSPEPEERGCEQGDMDDMEVKLAVKHASPQKFCHLQHRFLQRQLTNLISEWNMRPLGPGIGDL